MESSCLAQGGDRLSEYPSRHMIWFTGLASIGIDNLHVIDSEWKIDTSIWFHLHVHIYYKFIKCVIREVYEKYSFICQYGHIFLHTWMVLISLFFSPGNLTSLTVWRHTVFCDAMAMAIAGSRDDPEKKSGNLEWNDKELKVTWNWSFFLLMHGARWQGRAGKSKSNSMCDCANVRKCVLLSQFEGFEMLQQEQVARSSLAGLAFLCWIWIGHSWN